MEWIRGGEIGHGSFGSVNLALPVKNRLPHLPPLMAVKSCEVVDSDTLRNEMEVLSRLSDCPRVIRCFGDEVRVEDGVEMYNLFLEYAAGGSLANQVKARGGRLPESEVRRHTHSVLEGLRDIHSRGVIHCDIKLQNILVFPHSGGTDVKIADFGLSKTAGEVAISADGRFRWRGTPLYLSPETVNDNEYESPSDIWALGCAVAEMATGNTVWSHKRTMNVHSLMMTIGIGDEIPVASDELSDEGRDFLNKCFVKDPRKRWTAEMLLNHPFVAEDSPRCHLDFNDWDSSTSTPYSSVTTTPMASDRFRTEKQRSSSVQVISSSFRRRIQTLATSEFPDWMESRKWIEVR